MLSLCPFYLNQQSSGKTETVLCHCIEIITTEFFFKYHMVTVLTITKPRILPSKSLLVGEVPKTYSTILTPSPPVSERGDKMLFPASLPGKLPDLRGTMVIGWETAWSATENRTHVTLATRVAFKTDPGCSQDLTFID